MEPKVVVLSCNGYNLIIQDCPNRHYVVRNQEYLGSFVSGKFILKKPFEWAVGYEPNKKDHKKMTEDPLLNPPSEQDIILLEKYLSIAINTLFKMQTI